MPDDGCVEFSWSILDEQTPPPYKMIVSSSFEVIWDEEPYLIDRVTTYDNFIRFDEGTISFLVNEHSQMYCFELFEYLTGESLLKECKLSQLCIPEEVPPNDAT